MATYTVQSSGRYELIDGKIFYLNTAQTPEHNTVMLNIVFIFRTFLRRRKFRVFSRDVEVIFNDENRVIPDVTIVCNNDCITRTAIKEVPLLIVEILSPRTAKLDRTEKKQLYQCCGVKEYWLVDVNNRTVEVYVLVDGKFCLDNIFSCFDNETLADLSPEERAAMRWEFKTSLFEDLVISVCDIFEGID